ncbi:MAG: hypothetical protein KF775_07880 [Cyclobacteriaceae bacterium]|nr:hypothetical protein [Cytophagales bacterium]MBX2899553.1 hypothetical protein [Cyclobacteriaceae bacterium]
MKALVKVVTLITLIAITLPALANDPVDVIYSRNETQVVFKVDRTMVGATVEVISESGTTITAQRLLKRRMVIDFSDVRVGHYTIVVTKDNQVQKFEYVRNWR